MKTPREGVFAIPPAWCDRFKQAQDPSESVDVKVRTHLLATLALIGCLLALLAPSAASAATGTAESSSTDTQAEAALRAKEQDAAERRAQSSEFEREKLDQSAFDESGGSGDSTEESGGSEGGGSALRFIFGLVVVLGAIYGVHWLLKKWGQSKLEGVAGKAGVIDVVATTQLAQGRALHLVRVGEELVLVGATEQSISRIGEVDAGVIGGQMGGGEFQSALSSAMLGSQPGVPKGMSPMTGSSDGFFKRFLDNLRLSTAR